MALSLSSAVRHPNAYLCFIVSMLMAGAGWAEENLPDPTRPQIAVGESSSLTENPEQKVPVLQSVILSAGKARATISGKDVQVGDKIEGGKVIAIREGEVTLLNGKQVQVLRMFPSLEKRMVSSKSTVNSLDTKLDRLTK